LPVIASDLPARPFCTREKNGLILRSGEAASLARRSELARGAANSGHEAAQAARRVETEWNNEAQIDWLVDFYGAFSTQPTSAAGRSSSKKSTGDRARLAIEMALRWITREARKAAFSFTAALLSDCKMIGALGVLANGVGCSATVAPFLHAAGIVPSMDSNSFGYVDGCPPRLASGIDDSLVHRPGHSGSLVAAPFLKR
jgi:hypothetical protein